jgi:hypothetical protein
MDILYRDLKSVVQEYCCTLPTESFSQELLAQIRLDAFAGVDSHGYQTPSN